MRLNILLINGIEREKFGGCLHFSISIVFQLHLTFNIPKAYLEPSQRSKMDLFLKIVNGFRSSNIFPTSSILDAGLHSGYICILKI